MKNNCTDGFINTENHLFMIYNYDYTHIINIVKNMWMSKEI